MKELEKYITDENTGLKYELVGDYYFLSGDDEPEEHRPLGIWGAGVRWTPLPKAEAPTEPAGETNGIFATSGSTKRLHTRHW